MAGWRFERLPWLPPAPEDFRALCDAARDAPETLASLASHSLDMNQLTRLRRTLEDIDDGVDLGLENFKLGFVSNGMIDLLVPGLIASALRYGIRLSVVTTEFGRTIEESLEAGSAINRSRPDAVLHAIDHRGLPLQGSSPADTDPVVESIQFLSAIGDGFSRHCGASVIYQTLPAPPEAPFGSLDLTLPGTTRRSIAEFNLRLAEKVAQESSYLLDVERIALMVGGGWHDPVQWNLARLAFAPHCIPLYCDHVARLIAAIRGKSRKCLVLDLDDTLWGGVIGDDGLEGIVLGEGDPLGEAFRAMQTAALALRERGVLLAVCSKNEEEAARAPFRDHPDMVLREDDITVFFANWDDKATNLKRIADALNIGLDALVLFDDNPAERAYVRSILPEVAVVEVPNDPSYYVSALLAAGHFEAVSFTDDDRKRALQYRVEADRQALQVATGDLSDFLASLDMKAVCTPFDPIARRRVAQLINKTNQFNLTTRRYTEADIQQMEVDPDIFTLQTRLSDRFGDSGLISVAICRQIETTWEIDTWLMSCRVFGRRVEELVFREIIRDARERGIGRLVGRYRPTKRNALVEHLLEQLGFDAISSDGGESLWQLDPNAISLPEPPIEIVLSEAENLAASSAESSL